MLCPRDQAWADRRFQAMQARTSAHGPGAIIVRTEHARVGQGGPDILPGNLQLYGAPPEPRLLAEGECYHEDHALAAGEMRGGPWAWVRRRWLDRGRSALRDLDGLFTLVLIDETQPRLRLINDRYGSRRLYLLDTPDVFVFASELGPLLAWPEAGDVDEQYVREVVCLGSVLGHRTWLANVRLMPPATEIEVGPDGVAARRYWHWDDLPAPAPDGGAAREADLPAQATATLQERWLRAIGARVQGERVGQFLSGGLDSRLILGDGAVLRHGDWVAITYGEPGSDEVRFAGQAARAAGVPWLHWALPEPDWLEARTRFCLARDGVVDIVNAYQATMVDRIRSLLRWEVSGYLGDLVLGATYDVATPAEAMARLPYWHSPVALPEGDVLEAIERDFQGRSGRAWLVETKCRRAINAWPHAAAGLVEVRKPFMDYALVEFAATLAPSVRARHAPHRALLSRHPGLSAVPWQKTGVPVDASPLSLWAARARRLGRRGLRRVLAPAGLAGPPHVRGAVDLGGWLSAPGIQAVLRDTLTASDSRVGRIFAPAAIDRTLHATLRERTIAHEPLLHLFLAERLLADLAVRRAAADAGPPSL